MKIHVLGSAALLLVMGVSVGCSGSGEPTASPSPTPSATGTSPTPSATGTTLTIQVTREDGSTTATLSCDPPGGSHPDPAAACDFLSAGAEQGADPFAPVPADKACAEVYGGPQTATVTGVWRGEPVDAQFSRTDACQTARWDQAKPLLGAP